MHAVWESPVAILLCGEFPVVSGCSCGCNALRAPHELTMACITTDCYIPMSLPYPYRVINMSVQAPHSGALTWCGSPLHTSVALRVEQQHLQLELRVVWRGFAVSDLSSAADSIPSSDSMCARSKHTTPGIQGPQRVLTTIGVRCS